jgi:hypothetical protein
MEGTTVPKGGAVHLGELRTLHAQLMLLLESIGAVLPLLYPVEGIAQKIIEDPEEAPIPEVHKAMFRWVEKFTRRSWEMTKGDIAELRSLGVSDAEVVEWLRSHLCRPGG